MKKNRIITIALIFVIAWLAGFAMNLSGYGFHWLVQPMVIACIASVIMYFRGEFKQK